MNPFRRAQLGWDIRGSLLVRPFAVMITAIALAEVLPALEADGRMRLPTALAALLATEPGSAQVVLATKNDPGTAVGEQQRRCQADRTSPYNRDIEVVHGVTFTHL